MSNLTEIFKNHKAFIPFVVADDPDFETTVDNIVALAMAGQTSSKLEFHFPTQSLMAA